MPTTLSDQLKRHLAAVRAAGLEYVPVAPPAPPGFLTPRAQPATAEPVASPDDTARVALAVIADEVATCERCPALFATRTQTVFGTGPASPDLLLLGDAPWLDDDTSGVPFSGAAGELLDRMLKAMGFARDDVYLANVLKCRPPRNRPPLPDEADNCRGYLDQQLALVRPRFIACLGESASQALLGTAAPLRQLRGAMHTFGEVPVVCTHHPAHLVAKPGLKKECWDDMKRLLAAMGRPVPG